MTAPTDAGMVELIERLEKSTEAGKEIDRLIAKHIGWHRVEPRHSRRSNGAWIAPEDFNGTMSDGSPVLDSLHGTTMHRDVPDYTSSIDAALTLVPEGWRCGFEDGGMFDNDQMLVEAWCWPFESSFDPDWQNGDEGYRSSPDGHRAAHKSRAIAIVLAALRTRSPA